MLKSFEPRVKGEFSVHPNYDISKTPNREGHVFECGAMRVVSCCDPINGIDVLECARCGYQVQTRCSFDGDFS